MPLEMVNPLSSNTPLPAVTLGVTNPAVVSVLSPAFKVVAVTLVTVISSFSLTVTLSLSAEVVMLLPPLMPTRSPSFLLEVEVLPSASKVKLLSEINLCLAIALLVFVLATGPTLHLLAAFSENIGTYASHILQLSFKTYTYEHEHTEWFTGWTILYWAWWCS